MTHIWMSEWVMPHICITPQFALQCQSRWASALCSPSKYATHMNGLCRTYKGFMSHIWMSHVTIWITPQFALQCQSRWASALCSPSKNAKHMNGLCRTYKGFMSHIWMSHVTYLNHTSICFAMPKSMSFSSLFTIKKLAGFKSPCTTLLSCTTCHEWVMSHVWMSHVTNMNQPHVPPACRVPSAISESRREYKWVMAHI